MSYFHKLSRRNKRIQGFTVKFLTPRFLKSLLLLITLPYLICTPFTRQCKTILYRPNPRNYSKLSELRNVLVVGGKRDKAWAKKCGFVYLPFYPIYALSNFGLGLAWRLIYLAVRPRRLLIWTDYGLDHYIGIRLANRFKIKTWCVQHGLFPIENNSDLDGMDADVNVVSSLHQKKIIQATGYMGRVCVLDGIFGDREGRISPETLKKWNDSGKKIVFVGAGYTHAPMLENNIVGLVEKIRNTLDNSYSLIYRPHPRDANIKSKLQNFNIPVVSGDDSAFQNDSNVIFIGIKSTYLIEAQNAGKLVFLIVGGGFPKYFDVGEIHHEIDVASLNMLDTYITEQIKILAYSDIDPNFAL